MHSVSPCTGQLLPIAAVPFGQVQCLDVGDGVGASVGAKVGANVGVKVGAKVGASVGAGVGANVGADVAHTRSDIKVGATDSYCDVVQFVTAVHSRSDSKVGAAVSYVIPTVQLLCAVQTPPATL